jgi:hypothetical protein
MSDLLQTIKQVFTKNWWTLHENPILIAFVRFCIFHVPYFHNRGRFKVGDKVKYNLFARIYINSVINRKPLVYTIDKFWTPTNVDFIEEEGCDVFWIRKLYPWEKFKL